MTTAHCQQIEGIFQAVLKSTEDRRASLQPRSVLLSIVFTARSDDFHLAPSVRSCEKIAKPGPDTFFAPRNRLKIRNCPARKGLSVPDFVIFFTACQRGDGFTGQTVPGLTLGLCGRHGIPPIVLRLTAMRAIPGNCQLQTAGRLVALRGE